MAASDPSSRSSDSAAYRVEARPRSAIRRSLVAWMHQVVRYRGPLHGPPALRLGILLCGALTCGGCSVDDPTQHLDDPNTIGPEGGTVRFGGAVVLEIAPGALASPIAISVKVASSYPRDVALVEGSAYEFGPEGLRFARPVRLSIGYDPAGLAEGVEEASLRLHTVADDSWRQVEGSSADVSGHAVTGLIEGFSVYGVRTPTPQIGALDVGGGPNVAVAWNQPQWMRIAGADIAQGAVVRLDDLDNDGRPPYCIWESDHLLIASDTIWVRSALGNQSGRWEAQILNPPLDGINTFFRTCEGRNASETLSFMVFSEDARSPFPYELQAPWDSGQYRVAETYEHHVADAPLTKAVDLGWAPSAGSREAHPDSTVSQVVRAAHDGIADTIVWVIDDCVLDGSTAQVIQTNLVVDFGTLRTEYAQLRIDTEIVGRPVQAGDIIGWVADPETEPQHAGCASKPHLHLNVYHKWDGRFDFADAALELDNSSLVTLGGEPVFPVSWDGLLGRGVGSWGSNWTGWDAARGHSYTFGALPRGSAADLVVRNASVEPATVGSGGAVTLSFEIYNQGLSAAGTSTTRIQLSDDASINQDDRTLEDVPTPAVGAQSAASFNRSLIIPSDVAPGEYYIGITADVLATANQSDRTNDRAVVPLSVISLASNLVVTTSTTGEDPDPNGYVVCLNEDDCRPIVINGQITFTDIGAGTHTVELAEVAGNCTVAPPNPRSLVIGVSETGQTTFVVTCEEALNLAFQFQPSDVPAAKAVFPAGYRICPPIQVEARNSQGDRVTSYINPIGLRLGVNPSAASLSGGEPLPPLEGLATFESVTIDQPGEGYTLIAEGEGAVAVESLPFKIGLPGDLNLDDRVDQFDEDTLLAHWGETGACLPGDVASLLPADINKDGTVDDPDLVILESNWTAPSGTTDPANLITSTSARMNGTVNPKGLATVAWFEWGTDPTLSVFESTVPQEMGSGTVAERVRQRIFGLTPGTTYYYRVAASSAGGFVRGGIVSFTTD